MDEEQNVNKFLVVFDDGSIYIFYTARNVGSTPEEDLKRMIPVTQKDGSVKEKTVEFVIQ